jgi:hypothetical protein
MKCSVGEKKRETLQAQMASGANDGEVFGTIDFDQLQIENSQLQEKIDSRNSELLALKQATAMTLTRLNGFKLELSQVLSETTWLKGQKGQKMVAIDKVMYYLLASCCSSTASVSCGPPCRVTCHVPTHGAGEG